MVFKELQLSGVFLISPKRHSDERGFFSESFRAYEFSKVSNKSPEFVQDNIVLSHKKSTIRGLHYQGPPNAQGKLVSCISGRIIDIILDIRESSETYGHHISVELSGENGHQLWVPAGFAHGYVTQEQKTLVMYKVTDYYTPELEGTIAWNDPDLEIDWGIDPKQAIVSDKDKAAQSFANLLTPFK